MADVNDTQRWADNHCHLPDDIDAASATVDAARSCGVDVMIDVGCDLGSSEIAIAHAERFEGVYATAGVHPHEAKHGIDGIADLAQLDAVVAIGECGLDYHYDHSPRSAQREVFAQQIGLAHDLSLPLVIHTRDAWDDTFAILDSEGVPERTVFHCFTGGPEEATGGLERGCILSFSGIVTFKAATELHEAVKVTPVDRLMVETDAPYLTPVPHRGTPNQSAYVPLVGERVAALQGVPAAVVAEATWNTTHSFYRLEFF